MFRNKDQKLVYFYLYLGMPTLCGKNMSVRRLVWRKFTLQKVWSLTLLKPEFLKKEYSINGYLNILHEKKAKQ